MNNNGAATYSIPLTVPPGRAGMQPSLALVYNSAGGNGMFGVGFSLSGTSNITRCGKTVVVEGVHGSVTLTNRDRFCLDGAHLIAVNGQYGEDGTTYRTAVESFSKIVSFGGKDGNGPDSFKVWTKDGRILEYGVGSAASTANRLGPASTTRVVRSWALDDVSDRYDNHIQYSYTREFAVDGHTSSQRLDRILYTSSAKHKPTRVVQMVYEDRPDSLQGFSLGNSFVTSKRVSAIQMLVGGQLVHAYQLAYETTTTASPRSKIASLKECGGDGVCLPPTLVRWTHEDPTLQPSPTPVGAIPAPESGVVAVGDFDGNGADDLIYSRDGGWHLMSPSTAQNAYLLDPQHDKMAKAVLPLDHNLDGKQDLLLPSKHEAGIVPWDRISIKSPLAIEHASTPSLIETFSWWTGNPEVLDAYAPAFGKILADLDGDGVRDLIVCHPGHSGDDSWGIQRYYGEGGYFAPVQPISGMSHVSCKSNVLVLDMNGDGADDLLVEPSIDDDDKRYRRIWLDEYNFIVERVEGLTRTCVVPPDTEPDRTAEQLRLIDVDGDGLQDVVRGPCLFEHKNGDETAPVVAATNGHLSLFHNHGNREFFSSGSLGDVTPEEFRRSHVVSLRSDGRQSLMLPNHRPDIVLAPTQLPGWMITTWANAPDHWVFIDWYMSVPVVTQPAVPLPYYWNRFSYYGLQPSPTAWATDTTRLGDFNGDGLQDLMNVEARPDNPAWDHELPASTAGTTWQFVQYLHKGSREHIVEIRDGLHGHADEQPLLGFLPTVTIRYATLSDEARNGRYVRDDAAGCHYPISCRVGNLDVVTDVTTDTGVSPTEDGSDDGIHDPWFRTAHYSYRGGRVHRHGRGWLGFTKTTVVNSSQFGAQQDGPMIGASTSTTVTTFDVETPGESKQYLFAHLPLYTRSSWTAGGTVHASYVRNQWTEQIADGHLTYYPLLQWSEESSYELADGTTLPDDPDDLPVSVAPLTQTTTYQLGADEWGNVTNRARESKDGHFVSSVAIYEQDISSWSLGLIKDLRVTDSYLGAKETIQTTFVNDLAHHVAKARVDDVQDPAHSHTTSLTIVEGNVTEVTLTASGLPVRKSATVFDAEAMYPILRIDPLGFFHPEHHRDWDGALLTTVDPNGLSVQLSRDAFGRIVREVGPDNVETQHKYLLASPVGSASPRRVAEHRVQTPGAPWSLTELDRLGRERAVFSTDPDGNLTVRKRKFDPAGMGAVVRDYLVARFDDPAPRKVEREINLAGQVLSVTLPNQSKTVITRKGRTVTTTDPRNGVSTVEMDEAGRTIHTIDALNHHTHFYYGLFGRPSEIVDHENHHTEMSYDAAGNLERLNDPDTGLNRFTTDAYGQLRTERQGGHAPTSYDYDALGRVIKRTEPEGVSTFTFDTAAHGIGRLAFDASPDGVQSTYAYDALSRPSDVARVIDGTSYKTHLSYDSLGRVALIQYPNPTNDADFTVKRSYDAEGRLVQVSPANAATSSVPYFWKREKTNIDEQIVQESFGNNVLTKRAYDPSTSRVVQIKTTTQKLDVLQNLLYTYDENLNLASRTDLRPLGTGSATETFLYDALDRLCDAKIGPPPAGTSSTLMANAADSGFVPFGTKKTKPIVGKCEMKAGDKAPSDVSYAYDTLGNVLYKPGAGLMTYNPSQPHTVVSSNDGSYAYNDVGDQILRPDGGIDYTSFHLPKQITKGPRTVSFEYDAGHNRVVKKEASSGTTTHYLGGLYEMKRTPNGWEERFEVYGARSAVAVVSRSVNLFNHAHATATRYIHPDHQGSADVTTDETGFADPVHVERLSHDAFGAPRNATWSSATPPAAAKLPELGFTGHEDDLEVGLTNMSGRMYDPKLGRFLSADPVVQKPTYSQSLNRYSYVWNNPLTLTDPSGFYGELPAAPVGDPGPTAPDPGGAQVGDVTLHEGVHAAMGGPMDASPSSMEGDAGIPIPTGLVPPSGSVTGGGGVIDPAQAPDLTDPFVLDSGHGITGGGRSGGDRFGGVERGPCTTGKEPSCPKKDEPTLTDRALDWMRNNRDTIEAVAIGVGVVVVVAVVVVAVVASGGAVAISAAATSAVAAVETAVVSASPLVISTVTAGGGVIARFGPNLVQVAMGIVNRGGRFGDLDKVKGAQEVGHHMPQNAFNETIGRSRNDGPALGMTIEDHARTRTGGGRGWIPMKNDAGLNAVERLLLDIQDVRNLFDDKYDNGIEEMVDYARTLPEYAGKL